MTLQLKRARLKRCLALLAILALATFSLATWLQVAPVTHSLRQITRQADRAAVTDRAGTPLAVSYQNRWNSYSYLSLHEMPDFLLNAFVESEDKRFYTHHGVDWQALAAATWQNLKSFSRLRGASTIPAQTVRIIHDRPRTLWSKWLELWESLALEHRAGKQEILEFYCNEIPYAANRRGVAQAASYYFDRDLSTLTKKELLALVILARAPSQYDLYHHSDKIDTAILRLAHTLQAKNLLSQSDIDAITNTPLALAPPSLAVEAPHFVNYVRKRSAERGPTPATLRTTLDSSLQRRVQEILSQRLASLAKLGVHNAAAVVVDHRTVEILAWVVVGGDEQSGGARANNVIDAVTVPRQPGSALKPFLYALALDNGWSPATVLDDSPMMEAIGAGLHEFKNYSHSFYGKISLREALGNSLNIPALRTIQFVGVENYLDTLHKLGFDSLTRDADVYKDGLALGNGEVSLFEMAQAYTALANKGTFRPLRALMSEQTPNDIEPVYSPEVASLIANILSDPWARRLEFGYGSVLNMPIQTAVKTGTSTDYRDAWTMGFDSRYTVGVWMGNLDRAPMDGITGVVGPALALRSIFALLQQDQQTEPLYLSPRLIQKDICLEETGEDSKRAACRPRTEFFIPGAETAVGPPKIDPGITLARPTQGLQMAFDPRVPADYQIFVFRLDGMKTNCAENCKVTWTLNDETLAETTIDTYSWPIRRGKYQLRAEVKRGDELLFKSGVIHFIVK